MRILIRIALLLYFLMAATPIFADPIFSNVGIRQLSINYPPTKSEIKGIVWYPTLEKSQNIKVGPFDLDVTKNAEIKDGKYGLIVISHGSQGTHLGHQDTAVYLAKRGFIVVSVLHPILMYRGEKDDVLRYPYHAESIKQKLNIEPEYVVVKSAGHFSFLSPLPDRIKQSVGVVAKDPIGFDRAAFHLQMNEKIFQFLSRSLRNE